MIQIKRDIESELLKEMERKREMIQIKRDRDAWVVYVNGKIHPQGVGFASKRAAKKWIKTALRGWYQVRRSLPLRKESSK